jgi:hypothetical protein
LNRSLTFEASAPGRASRSLKTCLHSPRDLHASFEDTLPVHAVLCDSFAARGTGPVCSAGFVRTSSLGVPKDRPSTDARTNRPLPETLPKMRFLRCEDATPHTRAALAVSHDFDGLLRLVPCRSVAPCNRSWGSPRFRSACSSSLCTALPPCSVIFHSLAFPVAPDPTELSPRHQLCVASPRPIPPRRYRRSEPPTRPCRHGPEGCSRTSARPRGLVPMSSPLLPPCVATWW